MLKYIGISILCCSLVGCSGEKNSPNKQTTVGVAGAVAGGVLGAKLGGKYCTAAIVTGAIIGGLIGSEMGKSLDKADALENKEIEENRAQLANGKPGGYGTAAPTNAKAAGNKSNNIIVVLFGEDDSYDEDSSWFSSKSDYSDHCR